MLGKVNKRRRWLFRYRTIIPQRTSVLKAYSTQYIYITTLTAAVNALAHRHISTMHNILGHPTDARYNGIV